jgi:hypothetical protein
VREAEEVERFGLPEATSLTSVGGEPSELDQARLLGRQLQVELRESFAQVGKEPLGVVPILKTRDESRQRNAR